MQMEGLFIVICVICMWHLFKDQIEEIIGKDAAEIISILYIILVILFALDVL